jgi:hypothetical protein
MQLRHVLTGEMRFIREWTASAAYLSSKVTGGLPQQH